MRKLMEYKIISGSVVEVRRTYMAEPSKVKKVRGLRIAGNSSERKIRANEQEKTKKFTRVINSNVEEGWILVSLTFREDRLPKTFAELEESGKKFMRKLREAFRKETGRAPKCILVNANWSPEKNRPARFHHHILIESVSLDLIRRLWTDGGVGTETIDSRKDHTALAVYLLHNVQLGRDEQGKQAWHPSRGNLNKPIYTEPVEVSDEVEDIQTVSGSQQTAFERVDDENGKALSAYVRCVLDEKPRVRGRTVILGKKRKRETLTVRSVE